MTEEEIDKMEAGMDIDILISRKIFNKKVIQQTIAGGMASEEFQPEDARKLPKYSTHISVAWQVLDKFKVFSVTSLLSGGYSVCVVNPDCNKEAHVFGKADTVPLAICRAALKTKL